jgi:hypothetical protein
MDGDYRNQGVGSSEARPHLNANDGPMARALSIRFNLYPNSA